MRHTLLLVALVAAASFQAPVSAEPLSTLQSMIDKAPTGTVLHLEPGTYQGPLIINKPLTLIGSKDVRIQAVDGSPAIAISGQQVRLQGFSVEQSGMEPALTVTGQEHLLQDLTIDSAGIGIQLRDTSRSAVREVHIQGRIPPGQKLSKSNGIDLNTSSDNVMTGNTITHVQDGIYVEKSDRVTLHENHVSHSRYGLHLMYADETKATGNQLVRNNTGAMIMEARSTLVEDNLFSDHNKHVFSHGLMLYEAHDSRVIGNRFERNRAGTYVERSTGNEWSHNRYQSNFTALELRNAGDNRFWQNDFFGNVVPAQSTDSNENRMQENYWDDHRGLDVNGDGLSELEYAVDPYFLTVTQANPAYQLLYQSPGMLFLAHLLKAEPDQLLTDTSPSLTPWEEREKVFGTNWPLAAGSLGALLASAAIYRFGRKS